MLRKMPKCNKMYNHLEFYNPDGSVTPCCHFDKGKTEFGWNSYIPNLKYFESLPRNNESYFVWPFRVSFEVEKSPRGYFADLLLRRQFVFSCFARIVKST